MRAVLRRRLTGGTACDPRPGDCLHGHGRGLDRRRLQPPDVLARRPHAGAAGRRTDVPRTACGVGRLRLPRRRDVLRRRGPAPGVRIRRPATVDAAPLRCVGRAARGLADRHSDPARVRDGPGRGPDRAHRGRPGRNAPGAGPGGGHGRALGVSRRRAPRYDQRARPPRLGGDPLAARQAIRRRRPTPLAGGRRGGRGRPREQGHDPLPRRRTGRGARPRPALGRRALAVGLDGDRDRAPALARRTSSGRHRTDGRRSRCPG